MVNLLTLNEVCKSQNHFSRGTCMYTHVGGATPSTNKDNPIMFRSVYSPSDCRK